MTKLNSQINREVAEKLGGSVINGLSPCEPCVVVTWKDGSLNLEFDPCNSWVYAGPIIEQQRISLVTAGRYKGKSKPEDTWVAKSNHIKIRNDNPLVAAMLVFLEMEVEL